MLTHAELRRAAKAAPGFAAVAATFQVSETYHGLNVFAPVLGNGNASVMRELHDYARVHALMCRHEEAEAAAGRGGGGPRWSAVRARRLLSARICVARSTSAAQRARRLDALGAIWSGNRGTNDRHAVMNRSMAPAYFGRWTLLTSRELTSAFSVRSVQRMGAEDFLRSVLDHARLPWGEFPNTAYLACCASAGTNCFSSGC